MNRLRRVAAPLVAAGLAVVAVVLAVLVPGRPSAGQPPGTVLSELDRGELDAAAVRRGADPPAVDSGVDLTDPEAVARAYLVAAHTAAPGDAGRTRRRATGYAEPGSPPAEVGVVVLDAPPRGAVRTASVTALELVAADRRDSRRGYRATVATVTGPGPGGS
ncbi:hypothetical protein, partial [Pseudonocardia acidicola]